MSARSRGLTPEEERYALGLLLVDTLQLPDREPDHHGHRIMPDGFLADWDYWVTGPTGGACYWCGREATGVAITDCSGAQQITKVAVCPAHRPDRWHATKWQELAASYEGGTLTLSPPIH